MASLVWSLKRREGCTSGLEHARFSCFQPASSSGSPQWLTRGCAERHHPTEAPAFAALILFIYNRLGLRTLLALVKSCRKPLGYTPTRSDGGAPSDATMVYALHG